MFAINHQAQVLHINLIDLRPNLIVKSRLENFDSKWLDNSSLEMEEAKKTCEKRKKSSESAWISASLRTSFVPSVAIMKLHTFES